MVTEEKERRREGKNESERKEIGENKILENGKR